MPDYTVSGDVDSMLRSANDAAIRSAIGVGTTDAPTFLAITLNDTPLVRDAPGILAQRNGTAKQVHRVYNTFLGTTANEWGGFDWLTTANTLRIGTEHGGTGTARPIDFVTGGVARWQISAAGDFLPSTTNFYDIGSQSGNRPKTIWATNGIQTAGGDLSTFGGAGPFYLQSATGRALCFISNTSVIQIGGITSAFPAIKRSTTSLQARLADDSAFTNIQGKLTTDTAYTGTVVVPTGFLTLYDSTGTAYRVPCVV